MADHTGFLADIIEHPDDDTPRLIYADWLEEHGDAARANFIRAQCHLAQFCRDNNEPFESGLAADRLPSDHRERFLAPFLALGLIECVNRYRYGPMSGFAFHFRRGFIEDIEVHGADAASQFAERATEIFQLTPLLNVRFIGYIPEPPSNRRYYGSPVWSPVPLASLKVLLSLPQIGRLRFLDLRHVAADAARLLLDSPHLHPTRLLLGEFRADMEKALQQRFGEAVTFTPDPLEIPF
jgi:uncharacterized protein (TIGR02996 family)